MIGHIGDERAWMADPSQHSEHHKNRESGKVQGKQRQGKDR